MNSSNVDRLAQSESPSDATRSTDTNDKSSNRKGSSPTKSVQQPESNNGNKYTKDREAQEKAIQAFMKKQQENDKNLQPKPISDPQDKRIISTLDPDSDSENSPIQPRQRHDKVVFSPKSNGAGFTEQGFPSVLPNTVHVKLEKSQSIMEPENPHEFEGLSRTFTQVSDRSTEHSASLLLPARHSDITKSVCVTKELKFTDKANWTDELKCFVCARSFSKMDGIFTHHCRACGKSVCGDCSTRKINENRACDICFYRVSNVVAEENRKEMLQNKTKMIKAYKKKIEEAQKRLEELDQRKKELEKKIYDEREEQDKAFLVLQKEKVKVHENVDKKKINNQKLKETVEAEQAALRKKEKEVNEMKEVLNTIKLDLAQKKGSINSKQEESERLVSQKEFYEKPYYAIIDGKDDNESIMQRSSSVTESCDQNIQGEEIEGKEDANENQAENLDSNSFPNKSEE